MSEANETAVMALQSVPPAMEALFRHHVERELRRTVVSESQSGSRTVPLAVGFLDLVGFTSAAAALAADELVGAVTGFEALASDVITDHGARLVKAIGDEVMFVTEDPVAACRIADEVAAAVEAHPALTALRGGVAYGDVVALEADYYGNEVNLAARLVATAEPGRVLVSAGLAHAVGDAVALESSGVANLKGFEDPVEIYALTSP